MPDAKLNPFRGSLNFSKETKWWHVEIRDHGQVISEFFSDGNGFFFGSSVLLGYYTSMKQRCEKCAKDIDEREIVFVVYKVRENIVTTGLATLATRINQDDVFCSTAKLPEFLKWQMEEHKKTCGQPTNPIPI